MREYLFHGKRIDTEEWVEGYLGYNKVRNKYYIMDDVDSFPIPVHKESVGQYTGMNEFVVTDRSFNKPLFEGDIVEVWSRRRPPTEDITLFRDKPRSQYDVEVKARAIICFKYGQWFLDYDNEYNKSLCKLRGSEQTERTVAACHDLDNFQCRGRDEAWYREHNHRFKWHDIMKIGTVFENADLLEA
jgi:hypothetical protein